MVSHCRNFDTVHHVAIVSVLAALGSILNALVEWLAACRVMRHGALLKTARSKSWSLPETAWTFPMQVSRRGQAPLCSPETLARRGSDETKRPTRL